MNASVIVPNLHSPHLGRVIAALRDQRTRPAEVIVVGQDRHGLAQGDDWVKVMPTAQPMPQAAARNMGAGQAQGDVLCFIDSDCVPGPDWLASLLQQHVAGQTVVGGSIVLGGQPYWQTCDNVAHFGLRSQFGRRGPQPYLLAGNLSVRATTFHDAGGFDERFRYLEDTALSFQLRTLGHTLFFEPDAGAVHCNDEHNSARNMWRHSFKYGQRWASVTQAHAQVVGQSLLGVLGPRLRWAAWLAAPTIALRETLQIYALPGLRRAHWRHAPGVWWSRLGWAAGIIAGQPAAPTPAVEKPNA